MKIQWLQKKPKTYQMMNEKKRRLPILPLNIIIEIVIIVAFLLILLLILITNHGSDSTYNTKKTSAVRKTKIQITVDRDNPYNLKKRKQISIRKNKPNKIVHKYSTYNIEMETVMEKSVPRSTLENTFSKPADLERDNRYHNNVMGKSKQHTMTEKIVPDSIILRENMNAQNILKKNEPDLDNDFGIPQFVLSSLSNDITGTAPSCDLVSCAISCFNYGVKNIQDMIDRINNISLGLGDCNQVEISIVNTDFPNKTLSKGWLSEVVKKVVHISLKECNIIHIEKGAFSGKPFSRLDYLTIEQSDIDYLERAAFEDTSFTTIEIRNNEFSAINFEAGAFDEVRGTLRTLQLQSCLKGPESLVNITGSKGSRLSYLSLLDLRSNNIQRLTSGSLSNATRLERIILSRANIENMNSQTFDNLRQLKELDLSGNQLEIVENGTFGFVCQLTQLDLSGNQLTSLPEGILEYNDKLSKTNLEDNPWTCDCSLEWLQKMYIEKRNLFVSPLYCGRIEFNNYTFCRTTTSLSTVSTTPSAIQTTSESTPGAPTFLTTSTRSTRNTGQTTAPTMFTTITNPASSVTTLVPYSTPPSGHPTSNLVTTSATDMTDTTKYHPATRNPNYDRLVIPCLQSLFVESFNEDLANNISLSKNKRSISFYLEDDDTKPQVQCVIRVDGENTGIMYLLVRDGRTGNFSCYYDIDKYNFGINLDYGKPYSLCLIEKNSDKIDPYNCAAVTTPYEYKNRAWISNSSKTILIAGVTLFVIFMIILTVFIVFCCIRQHPELIKGNKRVIMVDAKAADALVMPKEYEYRHYLPPPSLRSYSDGYLTPRTIGSERHYEMLPSPSRARRSSLNSYHSPSYMRSTLMRRRNSRCYLENVYEAPPPLPPNHPSGYRYVRYPETAEFM